MCPTCDAFVEPANVNNPAEYRELVRKLRQFCAVEGPRVCLDEQSSDFF
jgi:hypothetical protein